MRLSTEELETMRQEERRLRQELHEGVTKVVDLTNEKLRIGREIQHTETYVVRKREELYSLTDEIARRLNENKEL